MKSMGFGVREAGVILALYHYLCDLASDRTPLSLSLPELPAGGEQYLAGTVSE